LHYADGHADFDYNSVDLMLFAFCDADSLQRQQPADDDDDVARGLLSACVFDVP
jgi:hypothetical protein